MADFRQEEDLDKSYDSKLMARLLTYARPYWASLLICILMVGASAALILVPDILMSEAVDLYLTQGLDTPEAHAGVLRLAMLLAGALVTAFVIN